MTFSPRLPRRPGLVALAATAAVTAALIAAPAAGAHPAPASRGTIVSVEHVQHLTAAAVRRQLSGDEFDASRVRQGVDAYRIVYRTVDVAGAPTTASGLVVLPRDGKRRLRVVNYTHGTMSGADEAPSVDGNGRSDEGFAFASAGYAAVEPDYLGLGVGPGHHPYLQLASETTATIDMLRAAFALAPRVHRSFDRRILVTGFSQGGQVAMAFGKALLAGIDPRFRLAADAPISGPYHLQGAELPAIFDGTLNPQDSAFYLSYFLTSWNRTYHLYGNVSDVFRAPYDKTVAPLFDGKHDEPAIFAALPATPEQLLTPAALALLRHPSGAFAAALRANDTSCAGWKRGVPIHIYAAHADEQVAITNAYQCQQQLSDNGVESSLIDVGNYGHLDSGRHGLADALGWFLHTARPFPAGS